MFLICRKTEGPLHVVARGDCEDFVKHYLKYNVGEKDSENYEILKTETVDINQFIEKSPLVEGPEEK